MGGGMQIALSWCGGIMNPSKQSHSPTENKTPMQKNKRPIQVDSLELTSLEEVNMDGEPIETLDPNYQSELEYDGYPNIEDYDNHAYNLDPDGREDPEKLSLL